MHLDGLRALAALYVVAHHCWLTIYPTIYRKHPTGVAVWVTGWLGYGQFAVAAFIVLSGYCLTLGTFGNGRLRGGFVAYMRRRARRIIPAYWAALLISAALTLTVLARPTGTHWDIVLPFSMSGTTGCALLVQDLAGSACPNHAFWSIAVEWHIYLLLPVLLWAMRRYGVAVGSAATTAVLLTAVLLLSGSPGMRLFPQMYVLFIFGAVACRLAERQARGPWLTLALAFLGVTAAATTYYHVSDSTTPAAFLLDVPVGAAVACLLVGLASHTSVQAAIGWRPLTLIGGFSYSLYLIHAPMLQLVWQAIVHQTHLTGMPALVLMLGAGLTVALASAWVLHIGVERRYMSPRARSRVRGDSRSGRLVGAKEAYRVVSPPQGRRYSAEQC